jgi:hypothetical protein
VRSPVARGFSPNITRQCNPRSNLGIEPYLAMI